MRILREGKGVEELAVSAVIIIPATSHLPVAVSAVEPNRMISFTHFEMELFGPFTGGDRAKAVEEQLAYAHALRRSVNRKQQKFRFVADDPAEREPDHGPVPAGKRQPNSRHRQQPGALRRGPGLAERRIEAVLHDPHHGRQVGGPALRYGDARDHRIGFASGARP